MASNSLVLRLECGRILVTHEMGPGYQLYKGPQEILGLWLEIQMGSITSSLIHLVAGDPWVLLGFPSWPCLPIPISEPLLSAAPTLAAPGWRVPLKSTPTHTSGHPGPEHLRMLLVSDWKAGLMAFQTYQGPREVETTALPALQQSIIIPSLPGSHHQVIPLLIKILQPLITQLIIAVFISPGLAVQALGGPRVCSWAWLW